MTFSGVVCPLPSELQNGMDAIPRGVSFYSVPAFPAVPIPLPRNGELLRVIVVSDQRWGSLKGIVQPRPQVAVEE